MRLSFFRRTPASPPTPAAGRSLEVHPSSLEGPPLAVGSQFRVLLLLATLTVLAALLGGQFGCSGGPGPQPTPSPEPTPPSPICEVDQICGCWHQPPGEDWQYLGDCAEPTPAPTPEPTPTPTPGVGCLLNSAGRELVPVEPYSFKYGTEVNQTLSALTGCTPGSVCPLGDESQREFQARVIASLRSKGICAGDDYGTLDQVQVSASEDGVWENHDVFSGDDHDGPVPPNGKARKVRWFPGGARDAWRLKDASPPGNSFGCSYPLPPYQNKGSKIKLKIESGRWKGDATPSVRGHEYCVSIGMGEFNGVPRNDCPVRQEGTPDRVPCERYFYGGEPLWHCSSGPAIVKEDNPALASCPGGSTWIEVCRADGTMCTRKDL